jgi:hypothetical protein
MKGQFIILHCKVDGMDSPQNIQIYKVSQHSSKWSLTFIINLLTILPIDHLGQAVILPMIAIAYKGLLIMFHCIVHGMDSPQKLYIH